MICPNKECRSFSLDAGSDRFCGECGTKLVLPPDEPLRLPSVKNIVAGDQTILNDFTTKRKQSLSTTTSDDRSAGNTKNIIGGNQHITNTTILNQDETNAVYVCAISGRQARVIDGYVCPSCSKWVHSDFYDPSITTCIKCRDTKSEEAIKTFVGQVDFSLIDGVLTSGELSDLNALASDLGISHAQRDELIAKTRASKKSSSVNLSSLDKARLLNAKSQLCDYSKPEHHQAAINTLKILNKSYPGNAEVSSTFILGLTLLLKTDDFLNVINSAEMAFSKSDFFLHDSALNYFLKAVFHRAATVVAKSRVVGTANASLQEAAQICEANFFEESTHLESLFKNSTETNFINILSFVDHFYESGCSKEAESEITLMCRDFIDNQSPGSIQKAMIIFAGYWPNKIRIPCSTPIHVSRNDILIGQFSEQEIADGLQTGRFEPSDMGWRETMSNWRRLETFDSIPLSKTVGTKDEPIDSEANLVYRATFEISLWHLKIAPELELKNAIAKRLRQGKIKPEYDQYLENLRESLGCSKERFSILINEQTIEEEKKKALLDEKISRIFQKYGKLISDKHVFFGADIPDSKLQKAYNSCVGNDNGKVGPCWVLVYESMFASPVSAMYITAHAAYVKDIGENKTKFFFSEARKFDLQQLKLGPITTGWQLIVDDIVVYTFTETKEKSVKLLRDLLQEFADANAELM